MTAPSNRSGVGSIVTVPMPGTVTLLVKPVLWSVTIWVVTDRPGSTSEVMDDGKRSEAWLKP